MTAPKVRNQGSMYANLPDGAKRVGRTTRFGNPFMLDDPDDDAKRAVVVRWHREWVLTSDEPITVGKRTYDPRWVREHVDELRGLDLDCSGNCKPRACHADVLLELANRSRINLDELSPTGTGYGCCALSARRSWTL